MSFAQQPSESSKSVQGILPSPVNDPVNITTKVAESITIISPSKPQSVSKRKSPRTISAISSLPSMDCSSIQPRKPGLTGIVNKSAVEGIKPLHNVIGEESNPLSETNRLQHETCSTASEQGDHDSIFSFIELFLDSNVTLPSSLINSKLPVVQSTKMLKTRTKFYLCQNLRQVILQTTLMPM